VRADDLPDGLEHDDFDQRAVQVIGWADGLPVATGRIVLPPGVLPTESVCEITVEPRGAVADVGRMLVVPAWQDRQHRALVALLAAMYLEVRRRGFEVACGLMSAPVRALARQLGLVLETLGDERDYFHERRAPVRFEVGANALSVSDRWAPKG
jgi:hypothetical protein